MDNEERELVKAEKKRLRNERRIAEKKKIMELFKEITKHPKDNSTNSNPPHG